MNRKFKCGDHIEIIKDINCIPAGVYKLKEKLEDLYIFTPEGNIHFGVSKTGRHFLNKLPKTSSKLTSKREFIANYTMLSAKTRTRPYTAFNPLEPITCCFFDPRDFEESAASKGSVIH